jgi:hypothetical protein
MWVLIRVDHTLLSRVLMYLTGLRIWFKKFEEKEYRLEITDEDREERASQSKRDINPGAAWKTCASLRQIWDWDNLGRGPWPDNNQGDKRPDPAPRGKGWIMTPHGRERVAGDCANPVALNYISCPKICLEYQPTTVAGQTFLMEHAATEHEERAAMLRKRIVRLRQAEEQYETSIKK